MAINLKTLITAATLTTLAACNTNNPFGPGRNYPEQEPRVVESIEFTTNPSRDITYPQAAPFFTLATTTDNYGGIGSPDSTRVFLNEELYRTIHRIQHVAGSIPYAQAKMGENKISFETRAGELVARDSVYFNKE